MDTKKYTPYILGIIAVLAGVRFFWQARDPALTAFNDAKWAVVDLEVTPPAMADNLNRIFAKYADYYLGYYVFSNLRHAHNDMGVCGSFRRSDKTSDDFYVTASKGIFIRSKAKATSDLVDQLCGT
jgi:hypothetical protein